MKGKNTTDIKHERFVRVVEKRMDTIIHAFYMLGKCSDKSVYEYKKTELEQIFNELESQISTLKKKFAGQHRFTLVSSTAECSLSEEDTSESVEPLPLNTDSTKENGGDPVVKDDISSAESSV